LRYIHDGHLQAVKVAGTKGPEWRIIPFSIEKANADCDNSSEIYLTKLAKLEREVDLLKLQTARLRFDERNPADREIRHGLLQSVAAFFMITGVRLSLTPRYEQT
jgi:hypothetical protein